MAYYNGFEWKSKTEVLGYPLVHVTVGRDPKTGKVLVSKGIIAIGQIGIGVITIAQVGVGLFFGLGQVMAGYFVISQLAAGYIAIGQVAVGTYILAQGGWGEHVWSMRHCDPVAKAYFIDMWERFRGLMR